VYGFSVERFVVLIAMMKSVDGIPKLRDALKGAWRERVFVVPGPAGLSSVFPSHSQTFGLLVSCLLFLSHTDVKLGGKVCF
jgi:hypothetical protein